MDDESLTFIGTKDGPLPDDAVRVVTWSVWWVPDEGDARARGAGRLLVVRYRPSWRYEKLPLARTPGRPAPSRALNPTAYEWLEEAVGEYTASQLFDPLLTPIEACWSTPSFSGIADAASWVEATEAQWHDLCVGRPVKGALAALGMSDVSAEVMGGVAASGRLLGDLTLTRARRIMLVAGLVVGTGMGIPTLANACLKSLIHDFAHQVVADAVCDVVTSAVKRPSLTSPEQVIAAAGVPLLSAEPSPAADAGTVFLPRHGPTPAEPDFSRPDDLFGPNTKVSGRPVPGTGTGP